ncbi:MAG: ZIP family metal transporter [Elusimicrobiales bacterium]|nr:ZIP family metal transporter [Elusimicrobiales bacterium]
MILKATFISFLSGMATMLGVIPIFFLRKGISHRSYSAMLGLSGGIMLSATFFSLLIPAMEMKGVYFAISGFLTGVLFIDIVARYIPHEHFFKGKEGPDINLKRIFLFMIAITIHNFPEGMSVGVGWALTDRSKSLALAIGIGIQNIPEGLAIALPLMALGYSIRYCILMTFLSAIVEPIGGFIGISLVTLFNGFLPFALAFASGCMFFVISGEMIPESHEKGYGRIATWSLVIGFAIMMLLDNIFK